MNLLDENFPVRTNLYGDAEGGSITFSVTLGRHGLQCTPPFGLDISYRQDSQIFFSQKLLRLSIGSF